MLIALASFASGFIVGGSYAYKRSVENTIAMLDKLESLVGEE